MVALNQLISFPPGGAVPLDIEMAWNDGIDAEEPPAQADQLDEHTVIIRQNLQTTA